MSLDPRRQSIRDARKTAFKTRKSNVNSLAQFGITGLSSIRTVLIYFNHLDPNDGSQLFKKKSKLDQLKRKSIFSVADFHADKFGCEEKLEAENEMLESLPFVIHPYSVFRIFLDLTSGTSFLIVFKNITKSSKKYQKSAYSFFEHLHDPNVHLVSEIREHLRHDPPGYDSPIHYFLDHHNFRHLVHARNNLQLPNRLRRS
jgi:predicted MPP superfamily phosphohydrolase